MDIKDQEILFEELPGKEGNLGAITLNRPRVLNALTDNMVLQLDKHLKIWEQDKHIKAVIIKAVEGRAFCAGGDIRFVHDLGKNQDPNLNKFFYDEYQMNTRIHHFSKPYIAIMDGITMGGGVGISVHGSHRVATPRFLFAMPETSIGFYPDIGATYFLPRLPHKFGFYLALSSARINHDDCFAIGIVTQIINPTSIENLIRALADTPFNIANPKLTVSKIIADFAVLPGQSELVTHAKQVQTCFSKNSVEEILQALETSGDEWCQQTANTIRAKSPTSLKVTLKALQQGAQLDFDECMRMEYRLTSRFLQAHDFFEGVRAVIIDKDQQPKWQPNKIEAVNDQELAHYFL